MGSSFERIEGSVEGNRFNGKNKDGGEVKWMAVEQAKVHLEKKK